MYYFLYLSAKLRKVENKTKELILLFVAETEQLREFARKGTKNIGNGMLKTKYYIHSDSLKKHNKEKCSMPNVRCSMKKLYLCSRKIGLVAQLVRATDS